MPETRTDASQPRQSLAQKRAAHALKQIRRLEELTQNKRPADVYGKYVPYVSALPATIVRSGLGQALAMERAGAKLKGHDVLFDHIFNWLRDWGNSPYRDVGNGVELFSQIVSRSEDEYIRAQAEVLEYLEWLKKFAVALLVNVKDEEVEE